MPLTRSLSDAVVVVTGASSGIGTATAYALARRGADIVLAARSEPALEDVARHCRELGGRALAVPTDVTDPVAVEELAARAAAEYGRIDGWVNNAAVSAVGLFDEIPVSEFRRVLEVNLLGAAYGIRAALPWLSLSGGGVVVNNASVLAEVAMPYQSAYNATKHGIRGLADTVRQELRVTGRGNISICTVLPATIDTPFFRHAGNHTGRELVPPPPVYPPEMVAETIVRLLRRPRREAYAGGAARLIGLQWRLAPALAERVLGWYAHRTQFGPSGAPDSTGNVFRADAEAQREGGWHGRRRQVVRVTAAFGLAAAGTAVGTMAAMTRRSRAERR
ncbi:SDR family oxidoreductase [Micromonospora purpureochromogenes]|uniref:NAD(P)-dependent dehydrogenase (Short-subunit alcohol dehydrogenase family) n=1 Tax=Micromonospora purpureochromogenes TaxID=47872 RepID=A0ABX2REY5_9ACTN|nr:SDR family oxidoreductase [Micromonospora purpureochromogenes]NYF55065.1 NAD(P)-dependent dehydrogenase (short-subunit alcohol dehydrogenase family) [Micromonospora purpureochromogenes]